MQWFKWNLLIVDFGSKEIMSRTNEYMFKKISLCEQQINFHCNNNKSWTKYQPEEVNILLKKVPLRTNWIR